MGKCQFETSAWWEGLHGIVRQRQEIQVQPASENINNENLCSAFSWWRLTYNGITLYKVLVLHGLKTKHEN